MLNIDEMIDSVSQVKQIEHDVARINTIPELYPEERQDSKTPTFALTYQGTYITIMAQGFAEEVARQIEDRYHVLYKVSDQWVAGKLKQAETDGYVTVAFGLRVRTPKLKQVIRGNSATPYEAEAEARTAGNALGQSYCLLNSRALTGFMKKVRAHPKYRTLIKPIAQIHDATYLVFPDDIEILLWVNKHLVEEIQWQELPDIQHDEVKLSGALSIFHPSWKYEAILPNDADEDTIYSVIEKHMTKLAAQGVV